MVTTLYCPCTTAKSLATIEKLIVMYLLPQGAGVEALLVVLIRAGQVLLDPARVPARSGRVGYAANIIPAASISPLPGPHMRGGARNPPEHRPLHSAGHSRRWWSAWASIHRLPYAPPPAASPTAHHSCTARHHFSPLFTTPHHSFTALSSLLHQVQQRLAGRCDLACRAGKRNTRCSRLSWCSILSRLRSSGLNHHLVSNSNSTSIPFVARAPSQDIPRPWPIPTRHIVHGPAQLARLLHQRLSDIEQHVERGGRHLQEDTGS